MFDGDGDDANPDYVDNVIYGVQLVPDVDGSDTVYDILVAGTTNVFETPADDNRDIFVARVNHDGEPSTNATCNDLEWCEIISFADGSTQRIDVGFDLAYWQPEDTIIVTGVTCTLAACVDTDNSPSSDVFFARLEAGDGDVVYSHRVDGGSDQYSGTYTDIAFSVVIQPQGEEEDPLTFIGGYSVDSNSGVPYMSGARFEFDTPDPDDYAFFRSDFANVGGQRGDQARELRIQSNLRIVAGGLHTRVMGSSESYTFGAMRLCATPDEQTCDSTGPSDGGGGEGFNEFVISTGTLESRAADANAMPLPLTGQAAATDESPVVLASDSVEAVGITGAAVPLAIPAERSAVDDLFVMSVLELDLANSLS